MTCSRKLLLVTGCAALVCGSLLAATVPGAKDKDKDKEKPKTTQPVKPEGKGERKKSDSKKEDSSPEDDKQPQKLVIPLPKGQDSKGVTIPYTDSSGRKSMVFKIGIGTRIDENLVKMSNLLIETFDEAGTQEMTIELPSSWLDMSTRTITGDQSVTISRSDFQLTGKIMEFNTETRKGKIKGDVKMIIYDLNQEAATPGKPAADITNQKPKGS